MRAKDFMAALGEVGDEYISEAIGYRAKKKHGWLKWGAAAACLCLVLAGGAWFYGRHVQDFHAMLKTSGLGDQTTALVGTHVDVGGRPACYHRVSTDADKLERFVGGLYAQEEGRSWYRPAGVDDLKYLICQTDEGERSLWVFAYFVVEEGETYTYGQVLETIYGVDGPEDIVSLTAAPSKGNNTEFGRKIQREVGTHTYTDREDLDAFYEIAAATVCLGPDSKPMGDQNRFTYSFSTDEQDKLTSGESTYATRVLSVTLASGTTVDSWKYNALRGAFFEYGGLFTQPLPEEAVHRLNGIFGIQ